MSTIATPLRRALARIFRLSRPYRPRFYGAIALTLIGSAIWLTVPLGLRELLDAVFEESNRGMLNTMAWGLLALFMVQALFSFGGNYGLEWVGERVVADLRQRLYAHLHRLGFRYFSTKRLGEITSRLTNDVSSVRTAVTDSVPELLAQGFSLLGSLGLMVALNWRLSAIVFLTVPAVTVGTRYFGNRIRQLARNIQDRLADTTAVAEEALGAVRIVKAFVREPYETGRYNGAVEELFEQSRRKVLLTGLFWSTVGFMFMSTLVVIFWYGGTEVLAGRLTPGDLVAFIFYAFNISRSISVISRLYTALNTAAGASDRIFELLEVVPEIKDAPGAGELPPVDGAVAFEHVGFAYDPGVSVLRDIHFEARPGETVAFVGPSGAGKTTLMHLVPRFFDVTEGRITVDGYDIREVQVASLRKQIALVPQDVHLFSTSIRENIRYGCLSATDAEVEQAARAANAHEFITAVPRGYDTPVGEKGVKLSGGQRQRIAIARALLKNPRILLLDEATSALDSESEALVQEALERLMQNRTTFIVAHRLSTVQHADRILVLEHGVIREAGNHRELYAQDGLYRRLYDLQFRENANVEVE